MIAVGETREMSGEANARSTLDLPGRQEELIRRIKATGTPYAVVLFSGRPLALEDVVGDTPALLEAWFPGVQAGPAVADVVFGKVNPGGKLPASFPYRVGQVPIHYNHDAGRPPVQQGRQVELAAPRHPELRPAVRVRPRPQLHDVRHLEPAAELVVERLANGSVKASVDVKNTGGRAGDEVVQLYIHDPVASLSQPIRRLRGFERVTLDPGQSRTVTFTLDQSDFGFYDNRGRFVVEPGLIDVWRIASVPAITNAAV